MSSKDSKSGSISLYSLSLPKSITEQTKDRFDAILKSALRKKNSKSREKLFDEKASTSASSGNLVDEEIEEDIEENLESDEEEKESKNYMLSKFLNDTSQDEVTVIKPPVPKPRTKISEDKRRGSLSSVGTYNIDKETPRDRESTIIQIKPTSNNNDKIKVVNEIIGNLRNSISKPNQHTTIQIETDHDNNDKIKTKNHEIGDLVLHDSPTGSKIRVLASQTKITENADHVNLSDEFSSRTSSSRQTFTVKRGRKLKKKDEVVDDKDSSEDENKDANEKIDKEIKTPKPTKRNLIKNIPKGTDHIENAEKDTDLNKKEEKYIDLNKKEINYNHITEIIIHKTDKLMLNSYIIHPVVKIHIVNMTTGKYYKKSDKNRPVVFYYENDSNDHILPVMSKYYNLQEKRTFYPIWEDTILLNEDFDYLLNENVLIFFEILDFVPSNSGTLQKHKDFDKGWFKIAFAFLKPVGKNDALNVNKQIRLQLFFPPNILPKNVESDKCYLFDYWEAKNMKKYPSTLYVTMKKAISPKKVIHTFRSKSALQREEITSSSKQGNEHNVDQSDHLKQDIEDFETKWLKKGNKNDDTLPEDCIEKLETDDDGCFVMKFSNDGQYLAGSIKIDDDFCVIVYKVENFEEKTRFKNHQELIYGIVWSFDDKLLLTSSADNTVAIWDFEKHLFLQILPHPNFVYATDINSKNTVATACYDKIIRIWNFNPKNKKFVLSQELENHKKYVTTLCFSHKNEATFFSADASGEIFEWEVQESEWIFKRQIEIMDLKESVINQIVLFSNEKKMVVHSRDSALRIISLANSCVVHWLYGALNTRVQTFCDISACSSYIICGSENGLIIVWNAKTGKDIKTYEVYSNKSKTVHCVQFHPKVNMFAASHYGSNEPILVYGLKEDQENENFKRTAETREAHGADKDFEENKIDFRRILRKMDELLID